MKNVKIHYAYYSANSKIKLTMTATINFITTSGQSLIALSLFLSPQQQTAFTDKMQALIKKQPLEPGMVVPYQVDDQHILLNLVTANKPVAAIPPEIVENGFVKIRHYLTIHEIKELAIFQPPFQLVDTGKSKFDRFVKSFLHSITVLDKIVYYYH